MVPAVNTSARLPVLSADVPGTGGRLRSSESDFFVEEVAAYEPQGSGDHVFAVIEKTGRTTFDAIRDMASRLGVSERDVGSAGLKDRRAVTRQTLSFPPPVSPEQVEALEIPGVQVVSATRHPHKLRTGHLRGNRFRIVVRETNVPATEAVQRATAVLEAMASGPGAPNWYGPQRFGRGGSTAELGRALVHGTLSGKPPRGSRRRLAVSAYQSALFNEALRRVMIDGLLGTVLPGDVLKKTDTGGLFVCEDAAVDTERLQRGEIAVTGPMFGHKVMSPPEGSEPWQREQDILRAESLELEAFRRLGKIAAGTRRPYTIRVADAAASVVAPDAIRVEFAVPAGSYATAVMREILKGEADFPE